MRNMVLSVIVLSLVATASPGQSTNWANKLFVFKGGPEALAHNFGTVPRGTILYYKFPMYNPWAVPIDITNLRVDCGCVTPKVSKSTLQPRETADLEITMDTARRKNPGPTTVSVYVTVGPQYIDTAVVRVSANIRADVVFNPGQINFGVVSRGQTPTQTVDVEYAGVLDWRVSEVINNGAPFDVALEEWYRQPNRIGYRIKATLKPDAPPGSLKHELQLKTNDPASPLVPLLIEATVQAPLSVKPNPLDLYTPHVGETVTKSVVVQGYRAFRVTGVEGLGQDITVDLPPTAANVQKLTFKWQFKNPGPIEQQFQIKTDLEPTPITLTVKANVLP